MPTAPSLRLRPTSVPCRWVGPWLLGLALMAVGCAGAPGGLPVADFAAGRLTEARSDWVWQARTGDPGSRGLFLNGAAQMEIYLGALDEALDRFQEAGRFMDSRTEQESAGGSGGWLPGPHEAGMHGVYVGLLHLLQGEPDAARVAFQRGVEADGVVPFAMAQDPGEEAPQRADNALLFWLAGRMAHLMGMTDRAFVDFGRAAEARRFAVDHQASGAREPRVLRDPIAGNLVCVVELGIAPEKTVGGPDGGLAVFLPRPQRAVSVAIELDGELIGEPEVLMDVGYQGATRGGAPIAGIRGREVVMADDPAARAQRPTVTGAGPLLIAAMTGEPVDTRHWSTLPATVAVLAAQVPPGQHALALRFADRFGVPLPELDQVHLIAIGEGQEAWFMFRDLPPDPAQLFPEFDF